MNKTSLIIVVRIFYNQNETRCAKKIKKEIRYKNCDADKQII